MMRPSEQMTSQSSRLGCLSRTGFDARNPLTETVRLGIRELAQISRGQRLVSRERISPSVISKDPGSASRVKNKAAVRRRVGRRVQHPWRASSRCRLAVAAARRIDCPDICSGIARRCVSHIRRCVRVRIGGLDAMTRGDVDAVVAAGQDNSQDLKRSSGADATSRRRAPPPRSRRWRWRCVCPMSTC